MEKDANIFLDMSDAEEFLKEILSMIPGEFIGERDGKRYFFARVEDIPTGDIGIRACFVCQSERKYEGKNIVGFGDAYMAIPTLASLLGRGLDVHSEDVE